MKTIILALALATILVAPGVMADEVKKDDRVISVDKDGHSKDYTEDGLKREYGGSFDDGAWNKFKDYAEKTGGRVAYSPNSAELAKVMELVFNAVISDAKGLNDIALVLDVTGSMSDDIQSVKTNLVKLIGDLQAVNEERDIRIALLLYRDEGDVFVNKVVSNFTSDLQELSVHINAVTVAGGGDHPEAVLDAMEAAHWNLDWRVTATKHLMVIGDAPGHDNSKITKKTEDDILATLKSVGILVHPVLVSNVRGPVVRPTPRPIPGPIPVDPHRPIGDRRDLPFDGHKW